MSADFEQKFRIEELCVARFDGWTVSVRPEQVTLGSLVIASIDDVACFHELGRSSQLSLGSVLARAEQTLTSVLGSALVNFFALMLVDRRVHFHVIPRYAQPLLFQGEEWVDDAYPGPLPHLKGKALVPGAEARLVDVLSRSFRESSTI